MAFNGVEEAVMPAMLEPDAVRGGLGAFVAVEEASLEGSGDEGGGDAGRDEGDSGAASCSTLLPVEEAMVSSQGILLAFEIALDEYETGYYAYAGEAESFTSARGRSICQRSISYLGGYDSEDVGASW